MYLSTCERVSPGLKHRHESTCCRKEASSTISIIKGMNQFINTPVHPSLHYLDNTWHYETLYFLPV